MIPYFMESDHADLDCIAAFCDPGFVYSTMVNARDMGLISSDTKLFAVGYLADENFQNDIGGEGTVQMIYTAAPESILYCMALIDNCCQRLELSRPHGVRSGGQPALHYRQRGRH